MKTFLKKQNLNDGDIEKITEKCMNSNFQEEDYKRLKRTIHFFLKNIPPKIYTRMVNKEEALLTVTLEEIHVRFRDLHNLGYESKSIFKMISINPKILINPLVYVTDILNYFHRTKHNKISRKRVLGMTREMPDVFDYTIEEIDKRIRDLQKLGFNDAQATHLFLNYPHIIKKTNTFVESYIEMLLSLGYTYKEALNILSMSRNIFKKSPEVVKAKLEFLISIGLKEAALTNEFALIQSLEMFQAKYTFLLDKGYYTPALIKAFIFESSSRYKEHFLVSTKEIMVIYKARQELTSDRAKKLEEVTE